MSVQAALRSVFHCATSVLDDSLPSLRVKVRRRFVASPLTWGMTLALPAGFSLADRHTLEFRAQGDRLTFLLDGQQHTTAQDSTFTSGRIPVQGDPGAVFGKIERCELPAPATASTPTGPLPWRDWLPERRKTKSLPGWLADDGTQVRYLQRVAGGSIPFPKEATQGQPVREVAMHITWTPNVAHPHDRSISVRPKRDANAVSSHSLAAPRSSHFEACLSSIVCSRHLREAQATSHRGPAKKTIASGPGCALGCGP